MLKKKKKLSTRILVSFICSLLLFTMFAPAQEVEAIISSPAIRMLIKSINSSIPNKVKKDNGNVDLGQFKDKNSKTPLNKNSGSFKSSKDGSWTVDKDNAGHGGSQWKLKKNGKRIGSLDGYGKVLGP